MRKIIFRKGVYAVIGTFIFIMVAVAVAIGLIGYGYYIAGIEEVVSSSINRFDVADDEIVRRLDTGDLVITSDIPLAAEVIEKGGHALSPRGELYSAENIKGRLNMRDFMDTLRSSGINTGGPPTLNQTDRKSFANQLDKLLTRYAN